MQDDYSLQSLFRTVHLWQHQKIHELLEKIFGCIQALKYFAYAPLKILISSYARHKTSEFSYLKLKALPEGAN